MVLLHDPAFSQPRNNMKCIGIVIPNLVLRFLVLFIKISSFYYAVISTG